MTKINILDIQISTKLLMRLFSKIQISTEHFYENVPCWDWTASRSPTGYGRILIQGRNRYAHRVMYHLFVAHISPSLECDHLCRRRHCVNPIHLEAVTRTVNQMRGAGFAAINAKKQTCKRGHTFTQQGNRRTCKPCQIINYRLWHESLPTDHPSREKERKRQRDWCRNLPSDHPYRVRQREAVLARYYKNKLNKE